MIPTTAVAWRINTAFLLLALTACDTARSRGLSTADAVSAVRAADAALQAAIAARDAERTAAFYAEKAVLLPVAEPIVEGRAAILEEWRHVFGIPGFANSSRLVAADSSGAGDLAYTRGTDESPMLGRDGRRVIERGKWVSVPPGHQPSTAQAPRP